MAEFHIDFDSIPDRIEGEPIPAGDYLVEVTEGDAEENIEEGSTTIKFGLTIIDGPFTGRRLRVNFAVVHPNEQRREIALVTIKQFTRACDLLHAGNTDDYIGRQCNVRVACEPSKNGKVYSNVKTYWSLSSQAPPLRQSTVKTQAPAVNQSAPPQRPQAPGQPQMWQPGSAPRAPGGYNPQVRPQQPPPGNAPY